MKRVAEFLTSAQTARGVLLGFVLVVGLGLAFAPHPSQEAITNPSTAGDSARVAQWQAAAPGGALVNAIVVWTRDDGRPLTASERTAVTARAHAVAALSAQPKLAWAQPGKNFGAILAIVPMKTSTVLEDATGIAAKLTSVASDGLPRDLRARLTGDVAELAAVGRSSENANGTLPITWLFLVSAVALLVVSRRFLLWLVPLLVTLGAAFLGDYIALAVGTALGLPVPSTVAPLVAAVAVGFGTASATVYVARYRRAYRPDSAFHGVAAGAWLAVVGGILAGCLIFAIGALVLLFAADSGWRAFGAAVAIAIVIAVLLTLVGVPAGLAVIGRRAFWPERAAPSSSAATMEATGTTTGRSVLRAALVALVITVISVGGSAALMAITAPPPAAQSTQARATIDRYYARGYGNQAIMIVPDSLKGETSVVAPTTLAMNLPVGHSVTVGPSSNGRAELLVYFNVDPGSARAYATIRTLRRLIAATGGPTATSLVGGLDARAIDTEDAMPENLTIAGIALVLVLLLVVLADWRQRPTRPRSS
jgi:putative drug exporter of the RND superfamily